MVSDGACLAAKPPDAPSCIPIQGQTHESAQVCLAVLKDIEHCDRGRRGVTAPRC